ncbi:MAG: hypothetical protein H0V35_04490 [Nitrospira sp.]|nr:hypothetical protein [Nitrospira sp.]
MAHLETLTGRLYLDTNIFVYALEGYPVFRPILTSLFEAIDRGGIQAVTSKLTLAAVLVRPPIGSEPWAGSGLSLPCRMDF